MRFNDNSRLAGSHAFLGASKYSWINYSDDKLVDTFLNHRAHVRGTQLHALAHDMIRMGIKAAETDQTFNRYVNDCIGFRLKPEIVLFYSFNCYGSADAIGFDAKKRLLRISDLKTGVSPTKVDQLEVYAALFCLEYDFKPFDITMELRIYQLDEVRLYEGDPDKIVHVMDRIVTFSKYIDQLLKEEDA